MKIHTNVSEEAILIGEDRLRIILSKHHGGSLSWAGPASLVFTILTALATANFQDFILPAAFWRNGYVGGLFISTMWLGLTVYRGKALSLDRILAELKGLTAEPPN